LINHRSFFMKAIQPSRMFHLHNWSIGAKLAASFGLVILVMIGLAATSLFSLLLVQRTLDKALNEGLQIEALGNRVQDRLSGARRLEQAFLLNWQDEGYQSAAGMYLMPRGSYIRDIRQAIVRLDNLTASGHTEFSIDINAKSRQLLAALETYHTEFNLVTNLLMDRGTNQSGAIGDLEIVSLELDAELEPLGQPELTNIFLRLRLSEKQYRLLSEQQYSEQMSLALQELRATLARVTPAESERLASLLDRYKQAFDELNRLDAEIANHIDRYTAAAEAIQSLAFNIAADGAQLADEELNSVAESVQRARTALVLAIMVTAALSIVLSIVLTRQISRPIRVLTDTAMEIERGNLAAQAHVESGDEVGTLATVFNSMTAQLRQTLKDLEQRVAERTAELTTTNEQLQREVVERKRAEEEIRKLNQFLDSVLDNANVWLDVLDEKANVVLWNKAAEEISGYSREEVVEHDKIWEWLYPDEEYRNEILAGAVAIIEKGGEEEDAETTIRRKDGQTRIISWNSRNLVDEKGNRIGSIAFGRDITERKRAEEEIRGLSKFPSENPNPVLRVARDGTILYTNRGSMSLLNVWGCQVNQPLPDEWRKLTADVLSSGSGKAAEVECDDRVLSLTFAPVADADYVNVYGLDITERKRAEEQLQRYAAELEQRNEEVKRFAYIISHDLRAPLTNLKGFSEELYYALEVIGSAMDTALPHLEEKQQQAVATALQEDVPEALGFIESSVTRMDHFINAVLKLSRLGRRELRLEPIDMGALVQATLQTLAHQIEERQVSVTVGPLPEVVADRTSMEQIMGNLLTNAVMYLDPDRPGEIEVAAECDHDETTFHVRDNGRGIAEEDMPKVFAPFRRAGKQDVPGEGMGLAYVQTLVRRHGGRIWFESEPGVGTTFTFTVSNHLVRGERGDAVTRG
jgi:PAS domain S-box-containing protein